jgi:hypothetical protein
MANIDGRIDTYPDGIRASSGGTKIKGLVTGQATILAGTRFITVGVTGMVVGDKVWTDPQSDDSGSGLLTYGYGYADGMYIHATGGNVTADTVVDYLAVLT